MFALSALAAVLAAATAAATPDLAAPARRSSPVRAQGTLHLRWTGTRGVPSTDVLFDPGRSTFDVGGYLGRGDAERHGSLFASLRLDGTHLGGDLRWVLGVDTGELRRREFPKAQTVCLVGAGTGLAVPGNGRCLAAVAALTLETTQPDETITTSNGRSVDDEAEATAFLREAYVAYSFGRAGFATLRAGRKRLAVGDGLVHDDYATGVELALDVGAVGPPLDVALGVYHPSRDFPDEGEGVSPAVVARIDWLPSLFEHAGLFAAGLRDRSGSVGELVRGGVVENRIGALARALGTSAEPGEAHRLALALGAPLESDATLGWLGTSGSLAPLRGQRVGWTLAAMRGTLHRLETSRPATGAALTLVEDVPLRGRAASLRWDSDLGAKASAGAFLLYLSGDQPISATNLDTSRAFLGIVPYVTTTNLFFGGGLSETFAARQVTAPGVNGRGVFAPGVRLSWDPVPKVGVRGRVAWLRADATGPYGGSVYGTEADLEVTWAPWEWMLLGAELDVLWPGDFYADRTPMTKAVLAVDFLTP